MDNIQTNVIHCGDNLEIMHKMPDESVDLIYLDPPFFSNRQYEVIWGDDNETRSFDDRWEGGIEHYIGWMRERLVEMHRILAPTGQIYLHCDHHAVFQLKVEMDKIFVTGGFKTMITWRRCGSKGNARTFGNNSDYILYYVKGKKFTFNIQYGEYSESTLKMFKHDDHDGRGRYKFTDVSAPGGNGRKYDLGYGEKMPKGGYRWKKETMIKKINDRRVVIKTSKVPAQKRYLSEGEGVPFDNIWTDIENVKNPLYPTEKPAKLLERIILSSSNEGDIVFDPFSGCSTTLLAAQKLGRKWIGIDISPRACDVIAKRLHIPAWQIEGMPMTTDDLAKMEPHEFQQWVCTRMEAKNTSPDAGKGSGGDGGTDGIVKSNLLTTGYEGSPIQVKRSKNVGVNVVKALFATMHDRNIKTGFIVALSFGKGAVEKVAKYKNEGSVEIALINAEDITEKGYFKCS